MDVDEDHEPPGHMSQPKDRTQSGDHPQSNTRTVNRSLSILGLNKSSQPGFKRGIVNSWLRGGAIFVWDLRTHDLLPFSKSGKTAPLISKIGGVHKEGLRDAPDNTQSSYQQDSQQKEEFQRPQRWETRTEESTLERSLRQARVYHKCNRYFIPITELERLITFDSVSYELQSYYPQAAAGLNAKIADVIIRNGRTVFAILVLIREGPAVVDLLEEITDLDLPISRARCKILRTFSQWTAKAVEDFDRDQWSFISPIFDQVGLHYELNDHVVLPFIEDNERHGLISGGYSQVWSVRIHPAHQKFLHSSLVRQPDGET